MFLCHLVKENHTKSLYKLTSTFLDLRSMTNNLPLSTATAVGSTGLETMSTTLKVQ